MRRLSSVSAAGTALVLSLLAPGAPASPPGLDENRLLAQLVPQRYTTLASELPANIETIAFAEGEAFESGDVLVALDCTLERAKLGRATAQLEAARAKHQGNLELEAMAAAGRVELAESNAAVAIAEADLAYINATLAQCQITAPWNGTAGAWHARPLEFVQSGQPIIDILDPTTLQAEFIVPTGWLAWFTPGYPLQLFVEELDLEVPLVLRHTAARADPVSQSIKAVADLAEPDPRLVAGMSGYLRVVPPTRELTTNE